MIELREVTLGYGEQVLLRVDELTLPRGRITAVIGRNGCGKSTLLRALVGVLPYGGSIRLDGDELRSLSHRERARRVAYLPQTLSTPAMSVHTLVGHGRFARLGPLQSLSRADRSAIQQAMELTDVWELRHALVRDPSEASGSAPILLWPSRKTRRCFCSTNQGRIWTCLIVWRQRASCASLQTRVAA